MKKLTKPGYTHIIVPKKLHNQLKTLAQQNNLSINQLIAQLINININVNVGISINTSINTATLKKTNLSLLQPLNKENSLSQTTFLKKEKTKDVNSHQLVGRAGFEPTTFRTSSGCPNRARLPALTFLLLQLKLLRFRSMVF